MQLYHEPAPLRKARQINFAKRSIFTVLATRCGMHMGGEVCWEECGGVMVGVMPKEASHPAAGLPCLSPVKCVLC